MAEYIEREALVRQIICNMAEFIGAPDDVQKHDEQCNYAIYMIEDAHAADVAPVIHSYWETYSCSQYMGTDGWGEPKWRDGRFYICHNRKCRRKTIVKSNYCPNCGARMDLEETDG